MSQPQAKKMKLKTPMPPRMLTRQKLFEISNNKRNVVRMKLKEIFKLDTAFESGFRSSNAYWRALFHRLRGEHGRSIRGNCY